MVVIVVSVNKQHYALLELGEDAATPASKL